MLNAQRRLILGFMILGLGVGVIGAGAGLAASAYIRVPN